MSSQQLCRCRTIIEIQRDLKTAIKMKHAAKKAIGAIPAPESSAYPGISPADAAGLQDDASSALCEAMGELGIKPEVCNTASTLLIQSITPSTLTPHLQCLPASNMQYSW